MTSKQDGDAQDTTGAGTALLQRASQLFELKNAATDALAINQNKQAEAARRAVSPWRSFRKMLFATAAVGVAATLPVTGLFFIALKLGSLAAATLGVASILDRGATPELRSLSYDAMDIRFADAENEHEIARLKKDILRAPEGVQRQFNAAADAAAARREKLLAPEAAAQQATKQNTPLLQTA